MSTGWVIGACLLAGAVVVAWPSGSARQRLRAPRIQARLEWPKFDRVTMRAWRDFLADRPARRLITLAAGASGGVGWLAGGPVAGLICAVYGALAARAVTRSARRARNAAVRARSLDELCALAADLRAGLPPSRAAESGAVLLGSTGGLFGPSRPGSPADRPAAAGAPAAGEPVPSTSQRSICAEPQIAQLTAAIWRLAERTGAPAADLVERFEADARGADRAKASAAAQAAGAQATALLLAALPLGGIALGYGIGADPLQVLLHTPLGAACAASAVVLQSAGLLWADRLANGPTR
jgi:tight adherence protein B